MRCSIPLKELKSKLIWPIKLINASLLFLDQGKGFPEEEIHLVFDKFYRLHDDHRQGTGLGLSIAKGFTEAHHGSIKLENKPEGGARFTFRNSC